jgi:hypothetical protein
MMNTFKAGDIVKVSQDYDELANKIGKIVIVKDYTLGVDFSVYPNTLDARARSLLHTLDGYLLNDTGRWFNYLHLSIYEEDPIKKFFDKHPLER